MPIQFLAESARGIVHEVKAGHRTTKVLAMYVVEEGKPLATPWQPPQSN